MLASDLHSCVGHRARRGKQIHLAELFKRSILIHYVNFSDPLLNLPELSPIPLVR